MALAEVDPHELVVLDVPVELREPTEATDVAGVLAELADDGRLAHVTTQPERAARTAATSEPISPRVRAALGVDELWSHQATAIDLIRERRSVVIATGTASGKSRC